MSPRKTIALAMVALAIVVVSGWFTRQVHHVTTSTTESGNGPANGSDAPDFTLHALDGQTFKLSGFRSHQSVVLAFWASWCGPCRLEMPEIIDFYRRHHDQGVEVLAVSIDEDAAAARGFAEQNHFPFPVLLDDRQEAARNYQVEGVPSVFVVDRSGKVRASVEGLSPNWIPRSMKR